ncbi:MAG TPA: hypothetical protein DCQ47_01180 [Gammaproteobacteria bacterium]|nr:hypothetical protein [Gammaproteobacteria bacterium]
MVIFRPLTKKQKVILVTVKVLDRTLLEDGIIHCSKSIRKFDFDILLILWLMIRKCLIFMMDCVWQWFIYEFSR